jgi:hypothetical protein
MTTLRKDRKPTLRERAALWAMTAGVVVLGTALVGVFVLVPVFLLTAPSRADADAVAAEAPPPPPKPAPKPAATAPEPPVPGNSAPLEPSGIDAEGFIRRWLVLAPIPSAKELAGLPELHTQQIRDEASMRPRAGEKLKKLAWQKIETPEYYVDFRKWIGEAKGEDAVAYAVCYVLSASEMKGLQLRMGSNDQAKVYLNGAPLLQFEKTRTLAKDQNVAEGVTLRRGENVLVFKVVNEKGGWQGCIRFTDRSGAPVKALQAGRTPQ